MRFIDLDTPYQRYGDEIELRMRKVLSHGQFILGPEVEDLEAKLAAFVGVAHAVGVSSGTHAIELALRALGIGPGDEVITVAFTFVGSAEPILTVGATPVFVDIEPRSFTLDVEQLEAAITARTRAILAVSLFGQMPDYATINAIAERHALAVIEDAAQSFGATQHGRRSGGVTLLGCSSFFPSKPLGCFGDGGVVFTSDDELERRLRALRRHGSYQAHEYALLGTNARLDTLQAAVLLGKLPHFRAELAERARIGARYSSALRGHVGVPEVLDFDTHVYAQYTIRVAERDRLAARLKARGIPSAVYYPRCLHQQAVFSGRARFGPLPASERAAAEVLSLPMHPYLSAADQDVIVDAILSSLD
jgi:UDP-2-acetamido-2-deoxy-ribo-hexuluronate aminotransferase